MGSLESLSSFFQLWMQKHGWSCDSHTMTMRQQQMNSGVYANWASLSCWGSRTLRKKRVTALTPMSTSLSSSESAQAWKRMFRHSLSETPKNWRYKSPLASQGNLFTISREILALEVLATRFSHTSFSLYGLRVFSACVRSLLFGIYFLFIVSLLSWLPVVLMLILSPPLITQSNLYWP